MWLGSYTKAIQTEKDATLHCFENAREPQAREFRQPSVTWKAKKQILPWSLQKKKQTKKQPVNTLILTQ